MSSQPAGPSIQGHDAAQVMRPARALVAWMAQPEAQLVLAGRRLDMANRPEHVERATAARTFLASRPRGCDQTGIVADPTADLQEHLAQFLSSSGAQTYLSQGWSVKIVDLSRVCALQPIIFSDHADERAAPVQPNDIRSIAAVSLPLQTSSGLPAQFDEVQKAWMIASRNPNLRLVGQFAGEVQPGQIGFGFIVSVLASYVQVALFRGRFVLRDGYHRSLGLLKRGIKNVPVLVREYSQYEDLGLPTGMLSQAAYLGDQPPVLMDYLDDSVAANVLLPGSQKMIVIHGMEVNPVG